MLSKLIKYEFKSTARYFLTLYVSVIFLTLLNKLSICFDMFDNTFLTIIRVVLLLTYILVIFCSSIMTTVLIVVRFYKNMLTDEGYLTHTLPVKTSCHINAKLIVAVIWSAISAMVQIISIIILLIGEGVLSNIGKTVGEFFSKAGEYGVLSNIIISIVIFCILLIISLFFSVLMLYCSLSIGSLFNKFKIVGAIVVYFIINFIIQILSSAIYLLFVFYDKFEMLFINFDANTTNAFTEFCTTGLSNINIIFIISGIFSLIFTFIFYILTNYVLSKKLNLD